MSQIPVRIKNVHKYYNRGKGNEIHVMNDVSLELPSSGMVAIFGKSGCGKTTLLNAIGGLDKIASGSIELFGQSIRKDADTLRNRYVGYIFQNYNLHMGETVYENVSAALRLCGMTNEEEIATRTMAALSNVGMTKYRDRTPDTLSGGQQQRVAIARALVKNPAVILADEPTGNLDETNTVLVMDILKEISRSHLVLLVTHEANLVDYYCDRVIEIVDGRVSSDRENESTGGYVKRDKNHIYLGELEKTETETPGVKLEYYGEPTAASITLQVVNVGGKLYLKASDPSVKILEEGGEIRLVEGVFCEEKPRESEVAKNHGLDMSALSAPVEGKHYGRLYHWKNSLVAAWRENFSQKKKKGKKLLRACLFLLAAVMVFTSATFGAGIRAYVELRKDHDESVFYVPIDPENNGEAFERISAAIGTNGIDFARVVGSSPLIREDYLQLSTAAFMTAQTSRISVRATAVDVTEAKGLKVVAGEGALSTQADILITTALADKLLEASPLSYVDEYVDLLGMVSQSMNTLDYASLRVVGVVESDQLFYYMDSLSLARYVINKYLWMPVVPASTLDMEDRLGEGEMLFLSGRGAAKELSVGDQVELLGIPLTVKEVASRYFMIDEYPSYVYDVHGIKLITDPVEYAEQYLEEGTPYEVALHTWLFEYYDTYMIDFFKAKLDALLPYEDISIEEWAVAEKGHIAAYVGLLGYDDVYACAAYCFHEEQGHYPTAAELDAYIEDDAAMQRVKTMMDYEPLRSEYAAYMIQHWNSYANEYYYVISDADYAKLSYSVGSTTLQDVSRYARWDYDDHAYYSNHLMIRSSDLSATAAFLTEVLGEDGYYTPETIFDQLFVDMKEGVLEGITSLAVMLGLMCLCVFFIMRSSFMSRVREVGVLRAIGVTKRNLVFRFAVETAMLLLLTVAVGFGLSAWFIGSLSEGILFSEIFYFPPWMALGLLTVISAATILFGVLPALLLLRKTPSEILAKYDI